MKVIQYQHGDIPDTEIDEEMRGMLHAINPVDTSFTLCGLAWDDQPAEEVIGKITCFNCILIIRFCKKVHNKNIQAR